MIEKLETEPVLHDLLREAARWRLLSLLFEEPNDTWHREIAQLAAEADDPELEEAAEAARTEADPALYHSTFGPGGPANPREVAHVPSLTPGGMLSELEAYYSAFGYDGCRIEAPDHVAVETGFVAYLRLKEAFAVSRGEAGEVAVAADAAGRFLAEHLSALAEPLAKNLRPSGIRHLAMAAQWLVAHTGPSPHLRTPIPSPRDSDEDPLQCL